MPDYPTLTTKIWTSINYLAKTFDSFENILNDAFKEIIITIGNFEEVIINIIFYFHFNFDYEYNISIFFRILI